MYINIYILYVHIYTVGPVRIKRARTLKVSAFTFRARIYLYVQIFVRVRTEKNVTRKFYEHNRLLAQFCSWTAVRFVYSTCMTRVILHTCDTTRVIPYRDRA